MVLSGKNILNQFVLVDHLLVFSDVVWLHSLLRGYLDAGVAVTIEGICVCFRSLNLFDSYFVFRGFYSLGVWKGWGYSGSWVFMKINKTYVC